MRSDSLRWSHAGKLAAAAVVGIGALAPSAALAQVPATDNWQFGAVIYGWFPELGGNSTFPAGTGSSINIDADTIIENLKFVFMGTLEARKGNWGLFTDIVYMDVGGDKSGTRELTIGGVELPAGVTANASLDIKATVWTTAATYRIVGTPGVTMDLLGGARLLDLEEKLGWEFSANIGPIVGPGRTGNSEASLDNWDAIIGAKGRLDFGAERQWFVPYYVDVGTGDSDLTWQAMGGIGYAFKWGSIMAVWRYLDYDFKSDKNLQSLTANGPAIGVAFHW